MCDHPRGIECAAYIIQRVSQGVAISGQVFREKSSLSSITMIILIIIIIIAPSLTTATTKLLSSSSLTSSVQFSLRCYKCTSAEKPICALPRLSEIFLSYLGNNCRSGAA